MKMRKKDMKKVSISLLITLVIAILVSQIAEIDISAKGKFFITIDGKPVNFTGDLGYPYLTKTQRTMVPIRIISENMGYNVDWSKDTWHQGIRKVWINNNTNRIELEIGKSTAIVNGKVVPIDRNEKTGEPVDTKAELVGSRTYVPLRFITEAMGGKVEYEWKDGNHYIYIITGKDTEPVKPTEPTTPSKIKGNVDEMTIWEGFEAIMEYFGKYQYGNTPTFKAIEGSADGAFFWITDSFVEDPYEVMIVIHAWDTPEGQVVAEKLGSAHLYKLINPTVKEVLRFYLPNGGADELYKIIDDGFNSRLASRDAVINKDISGLIGADRPVKIVPGGGLRIYIGRNKSTGLMNEAGLRNKD